MGYWRIAFLYLFAWTNLLLVGRKKEAENLQIKVYLQYSPQENVMSPSWMNFWTIKLIERNLVQWAVFLEEESIR